MYVTQLSEKVHAERLKNPPVMIEAKTTDQAMQKIRCILQKNVRLLIPLDSLLLVFSWTGEIVIDYFLFLLQSNLQYFSYDYD